MTLAEVLQLGADRLRRSATAKRDAELLLIRAARCDRTTLLTHPDQVLSNDSFVIFSAFVARRAFGEPVQYILGEQEFFGLPFEVDRDVLVPRPETEHLVEALLASLSRDQPLQIADVGTGSGAIAVALAHHLPLAHIVALDNSSAALAVARRNASRNGVDGQIEFLESNLLNAVKGKQSFDAIASNPPYIADSDQLEPQVRDYEPRNALFAGPTGLEVYERLIPQAASHLKPGGWLMLEIGAGQRESVEQMLSAWHEIEFIADLRGIPRVVVARSAR
jgi:release factor glutamine methyltransferase